MSSDILIEKKYLPNHISIIMDGNNRWYKNNNNNSRLSGHWAGARQARSITNYCADLNIKYLTLFVFSSENWKRSKKEVNALLDLFFTVLQNKEIKKLHKRNIRINFIGNRQNFSNKITDRMQAAEKLTRNNTGLLVNIAANYGGRWDVVNAIRRISLKVGRAELKADEINEELVGSFIALGDIPDPDLCIRTGGEKRLSNFLLWHFAYTEFYFTDILWPDFSNKEFDTALEFYSKIHRRFGASGT